MNSLTENEQKALRIGNNKKELLKKLKETKNLLMPIWREKFKKFTFDFENKRLVGSNNYILQWQLRSYPDKPEGYNNQQTRRGIVCLCGVYGDGSLIYFTR